DLQNDPGEILDLADDPAQQERIAALNALLKELQGEVGDGLDLDAPPQNEPTFTLPSAGELERLRKPWKGRS
ncbi:MAG: hypothetical protein AAF907_16500, partial [Planctomycetota bacterium]